MKILHYDRNTLVIRASGMPLGGAIFCFVVACFGLFVFVKVNIRYRLTCERAPDTQERCHLTQTLLGIPVRRESIGALQKVQAHTICFDKAGRLEVILVTTDTEIKFKIYPDTQNRQRFIEEARTFIRSPHLSQLNVAMGRRLEVVIIFFLVPAMFLVLSTRDLRTTWTFDRARGTLTFQRKTLIGKAFREYPLHDIVDAHVIETEDSEGGIHYDVALELRDGKRMYMPQMWARSNRAIKERAAIVIRKFLSDAKY